MYLRACLPTYLPTYIALHYIMLRYVTLHYITFHYIILHHIASHYIHNVNYTHSYNICIHMQQWQQHQPLRRLNFNSQAAAKAAAKPGKAAAKAKAAAAPSAPWRLFYSRHLRFRPGVLTTPMMNRPKRLCKAVCQS